jgi:hypothetical protein
MNPITQRSLTILLWNANGLVPHKDELDTLIQDIALVTETHLTVRSYLNIKDNRLYRIDHPDNRAQGGAAIFIRHITHHLIPNIPADFLQATSLSISTPHFSFTVSAVYCPRNKNKS